jgi:hypothetical protein
VSAGKKYETSVSRAENLGQLVPCRMVANASLKAALLFSAAWVEVVAQSDTFTNCPARYQATFAIPTFKFTTDPGVDYATFCYRHEGHACLQDKLTDAMGVEREGRSYTYVRLPELSILSAGGIVAGGYHWQLLHGTTYQPVAVPGTTVESCAEAQTVVCAHCVAQASAATECTEGCQKLAANCISSNDHFFFLPKFSGDNRPEQSFRFRAFTANHDPSWNCIPAGGGSGSSEYSRTCCEIAVDIVGALLHCPPLLPGAGTPSSRD